MNDERPEGIGEELEQRLVRALHVFSASPSFDLLKRLHLKELLRDENIPEPLRQKSIGDVVGWAERLSQVDGATRDFAEKLLALIEPHVPSIELAAATVEFPSCRPRPQERRSAHRTLSSAEASQKLSEAFEKLRAARQFENLKQQLVGQYWKTDWLRSPFLECLTFQQLSELRPELLLKKRSFTLRIAATLLAAIESALEGGAAAGAAAAQRPEGVADQSTFLCRWAPAVHQRALPAHLQAALFFYQEQCRRAGQSAFGRLARALPRTVSDGSLLLLWLIAEHEPPLAAALLRLEEHELLQEQRSVEAKFKEVLMAECQQLCAQWDALLAGPGVPFRLLFEPYADPHADRRFQELLCELFLRAFGAAELAVRGKTLPGYWTKNQAFVEMALQGLRADRQEHEELLARLKVLFPLIDSALLADAILESAAAQ